MGWLLFETKAGDWLCAILERIFGIALVPVSQIES
jgi:hypothetical protein